MRYLHLLIYYLVYDYPQQEPLTTEVLNENFVKEGLDIKDILDKEIPVYSKTIDWKMFIPPLPVLKGNYFSTVLSFLKIFFKL